jgi:hypothetical protein
MKKGPARGLINLKEKNTKIFLSKTTRRTALIFGMSHHLVVLYKDCSNYDPRVSRGPVRELISLYKVI